MQGISAPGGGSGSGSMSTVSRDDNWVLSSEDSSCPDESELELGLGLSLGGGGSAAAASIPKTHQGSRAQYTRILTAKDFPSVVSSSSSSAVSSSSSLSRASVTAGTKRSADSVAAAANNGGQVVGWPPIRAYRMNSLSNQAKSQATDKSKNSMVEKPINDGDENDGCTKENGHPRRSSFVKVNMDGSAIGRKVDLSAHGSYTTLAETLEDMFLRPSMTVSNSTQERSMMVGTAGHSKLLDGTSGFVLTYEDKDGDWMLVGDVPWRMFVDCVKRLRIMRTSEANGLAPRVQDEHDRLRSKPI